MATTKIIPIRSSPAGCLDYTMKNKGTGTEFEIKGVTDGIAYAMSDKHDGEYEYCTLTTHYNCIPGAELESFNSDIANGRGSHYNGNRTKDGKVIVTYHLIQSFEGHEVDPQTANDIGLKLAKEVFADFACVISTHTNTDNIHNHIVICAWNKDGYKWHDCDATKRQIRSVSDRLCEEHGLSVLINTQNMIMKEYTDKDGKRRRTEVTDRKKALWKDYRDGKKPIAGANDYRNSEAFKAQAAYEQSNRESIKEDIDLLIPHVSSYDDLLDRLRDMGYHIKDKKANGDYRQHVTFQAPGQQKGTRDYKLGDGIFYTRERLETHISSLAAFRAVEMREHITDTGDKKAATERNPEQNNMGMHIVGDGYCNMDCQVDSPNREPAQKVILDTRETRAELDKASLDKSVRNEVYIERLRQQISNNVKVLSFIEDKGLHSYSQINGLYKSAYDLYIKASGELTKLDNEVYRLEKLMMLPQTIKALETRLINEDTKYEDIETEMALLTQFKEISDKYCLDTPEGMEKLNRDIERVKNRIAGLKPVITQGKAELRKYEMCVRTLDRIDRKNGTRDEQAMKEHNKIKAQGCRRETGHGKDIGMSDYER